MMTGGKAADTSTQSDEPTRKRPRLPRAAKDSEKEIIQQDGFTFKRKKRSNPAPPPPFKVQPPAAELTGPPRDSSAKGMEKVDKPRSENETKASVPDEPAPAPPLPTYSPMPESDFTSSLTAEPGALRFSQLVRRVCRAEVAHLKKTFPDHSFLADAAESILRTWVKSVALLTQQHNMAAADKQAIEAAVDLSSEPQNEAARLVLLRQKEILRMYKAGLEAEEKEWEKILSVHGDSLAGKQAEAPAPEPAEAVEDGPSVTEVLNGALEESQRKLAFQAEALCNLVSGVESLCARSEAACEALAEDFHREALGPLQVAHSPKDRLKGMLA